MIAVLAVAASTLWGLSLWARLAGSRATPVEQPASPLALLVRLLPLVMLQVGAGWAALGPAGGLFSVAAAWMLMGWIFVLALNLSARRILRLSWWLGGVGLAGCGLQMLTVITAI